jgi:hypothetical protein
MSTKKTFLIAAFLCAAGACGENRAPAPASPAAETANAPAPLYDVVCYETDARTKQVESTYTNVRSFDPLKNKLTTAEGKVLEKTNVYCEAKPVEHTPPSSPPPRYRDPTPEDFTAPRRRHQPKALV